MINKVKLNLFWKVVLFYIIVYYGGLVLIFPAVSQWAVQAPKPLSMPAASLAMYRLLILAGLFIYISSSAGRRKTFLDPLFRFFGTPGTRREMIARRAVLALLPLVVGAAYYVDGLPRLSTPSGVRIQHPTMPRKFEKLASPARHPGEVAVKAFLTARAEAGEEKLSLAEARTQLVEQNMREGTALYAINCRPCHGMQANGAGPMARGFRLKPANFRDPGLLPTVVESYAFWRVSKGGPGLPSASTPWDSAMPIWGLDLSEEARWKVLLGEYFISGVGPREPEHSE